MVATAHVINLSNRQPVSLVVSVAPPGQPLQALADQTRLQLTDVLGAEREKLLFDGGDKGVIDTMAFEPSGNNGGAPRYVTTTTRRGRILGEGPFSKVPGPILERFVYPWLEQLGVTNRDPAATSTTATSR